jgi:hypothetical protein
MARATASNSQDVDIPDLIKVICDYRKERYQYERYVALLTFSMWLSAPKAPKTVRLAATVAAGRVILAIHRGEIEHSEALRQTAIDEVAKHAFSALDAAEAVADPSQPKRFSSAAKRALPCLGDAGVIVAFMLACPLKSKPSINKAWDFIKSGGFANRRTIGERRIKGSYKPVEASLKISWSEFASSGPFALAAECSSEQSILKLPPDAEVSIREASKLLQNIRQIREYFAHPAYIQKTLISRLDRISLRNITFVKIPDEIDPVVIEMHPFDDEQVNIVKEYRAPSPFKKPGRE